MTRVLTTLAALLFALPLFAQNGAADRLYDTLGMDDIVAVMAAEGISYGDELEQEMFPNQGGAQWQTSLQKIYDLKQMQATLRTNFIQSLQGADVERMLEFFDTTRGAEIAMLEVTARQSMVDKDVEHAAQEAAQMQAQGRTARFLQVEDFINVNDLINRNVEGALNANMAFFQGLAAGGAMPDMTESDMLREVWASEAETRQSTHDWLRAYLLLAYGSLSDADMQSYLEFCKDPAGRDLVTASFAAYDAMFNDMSYALGLAAAQRMMEQAL